MPRFFVPDLSGEMLTLSGEDGRHAARSLRCRVGEELVLCDGRGEECRCAVAAVEEDTLSLRVLERRPSAGELPCRVTLYQALPKGDKLELIVQKAVELGAAEIVPVLTRRCVSRPDARSMERKLERLRKIALEAAKQSGRGVVPRVAPLLDFPGALEAMAGARRGVLFYEGGGEPLGAALADRPETLALMVGPEGGFEPAEAAAARERGLALCTLGPRILRCETAPLAALAAVGYAYENEAPAREGGEKAR